MEQYITLHYRPGNNHGCHGSGVVIKPVSERKGYVVSASACSTCVGDASRWERSFLGRVVAVPDKFWGNWEYLLVVQEIDGSFSLADETRLLPSQLEIIGDIPEEEEAYTHAF